MAGKDPLPLILPAAAPPDPVLIYERLQGPSTPYSFILDSALPSERLGRYSWVGLGPFLVLESKEGRVKLSWNGREKSHKADPFEVLGQILNRYQMAPPLDAPVPFWGGAVGFFSYDLGRRIETLPAVAIDDLDIPDLVLGFYDTIVAVDHLKGAVYVCSTGLPLAGNEAAGRAEARAGEILQKLEAAQTSPAHQKPCVQQPLCSGTGSCRPASQAGELPGAAVSAVPPGTGTASPNTMAEMGELSLSSIHSHFTRKSYCRAVERAKDYIAAGDIFQVNLSQRLSAVTDVPPWDLYRRLKRVNPAPFASYLQYPGLAVVGASPERFLRLTGRRVETRPIKGTRPRGRDEWTDRAMGEELWNSLKDRAELTMIIDLERNDLGRVCKTGTVKVPELFCLEEYPTVFHLVSTVVGKLASGKTLVDLLRASFPGGSITGAPKIRAMEIIEELEPVRRGIYTGSTGWIGFHGDADLNIVIRTVVLKDGKAHIQVGGGITADSVPEAEYEETLDKARALLRALMENKSAPEKT